MTTTLPHDPNVQADADRYAALRRIPSNRAAYLANRADEMFIDYVGTSTTGDEYERAEADALIADFDTAMQAFNDFDTGYHLAIRTAMSAAVGDAEWSGDVDPSACHAFDSAARVVVAQLLENVDRPPICPDCQNRTVAVYDDGSKLCGHCYVNRH